MADFRSGNRNVHSEPMETLLCQKDTEANSKSFLLIKDRTFTKENNDCNGLKQSNILFKMYEFLLIQEQLQKQTNKKPLAFQNLWRLLMHQRMIVKIDNRKNIKHLSHLSCIIFQ